MRPGYQLKYVYVYVSIDICLYIHLHLYLYPYPHNYAHAHTHTLSLSNIYILLVLFLKHTVSEIQFHKHILKVNFLHPFDMNTKSGCSNPPHTPLVITYFREALCTEESKV